MSHHSREREHSLLEPPFPDFKEEPALHSEYHPAREINPAQQKDLEEALVVQMEMQRKLHEQLEVSTGPSNPPGLSPPPLRTKHWQGQTPCISWIFPVHRVLHNSTGQAPLSFRILKRAGPQLLKALSTPG